MEAWLQPTAWTAWIASGKLLTILFWSGLALLSIGLLVLMRTRWGQARPISKCAALSLFAHILLLTLAYGTHLIEPVPDAWEEPIRMRWIGPDDDFTDAESAEARPWETAPSLDPGDVSDLSGVPAPALKPHEATDVSRSLMAEPLEAPALLDDPRDLAQLLVNQRADPTTDEELDALPPPRVGSEVMESDVAAVPPEPLESPAKQAANPPPAELADMVETMVEDSPAPLELPSTMLLPERTQLTVVEPELSLDEAALSQLANIAQGPDSLDRGDAFDPLQSSREAPSALPIVASDGGWRPLRLGDGQAVPQPYEARFGDRLAMALRFGGDQGTEQAVAAALSWLSRAQSGDGRWQAAPHGGEREMMVLGQNRGGASMRVDTGITALALLAFLGAGHSHYDGEHQAVVKRGLDFLLRCQASNGDLAGSSGPFARMYCHGMSFLALSEAYGMTGDPGLAQAVRSAASFTVNSQHPTTGGWRYLPQDRGDTSQFGWQAMALRSAELSGIPITPVTRQRMAIFLDSVATGPYRGLASYRPQEAPSATMTAEWLASRMLLEFPTSSPQIDEGVRYILANPPVVAGKLNLYGMYYGSLAIFPQQGEAWNRWNRMMKEQLLPRQVSQGPHAGSWSPDTLWGGYGGRVYSTAMAAMCLEVYYRHLPVYAAGPIAKRP